MRRGSTPRSLDPSRRSSLLYQYRVRAEQGVPRGWSENPTSTVNSRPSDAGYAPQRTLPRRGGRIRKQRRGEPFNCSPDIEERPFTASRRACQEADTLTSTFRRNLPTEILLRLRHRADWIAILYTEWTYFVAPHVDIQRLA